MNRERPRDITNRLSLGNKLARKIARAAEADATLSSRLAANAGRSRIKARSNSAIPTNTIMIILPACIAVLAQGSEVDWNWLLASLIASIVLSRSRVEHTSRSSFPTKIVSRPDLIQHWLEFRPLPTGAGDLFPEDLLTTAFFKTLS